MFCSAVSGFRIQFSLSPLKSRFGYRQVLHFKKITYISSPSNLIRPRVRSHITFKVDVVSLLYIGPVEREAQTENGLRNICNEVSLYFVRHLLQRPEQLQNFVRTFYSCQGAKNFIFLLHEECMDLGNSKLKLLFSLH